MIPKKQNKQLVLFFTYGVSLAIWEKAGTLGRDARLYQELQKHNIDVLFVTYGKSRREKELADRLGISIFYNKWHLPTFLYYVFLPVLLLFQSYKNIGWIKSHQYIGVFPAYVYARLKKVSYVARGGYLPTYFFAKEKRYSLRRWLKYIFVSIDEWIVVKKATVICLPSKEEEEYLQRKYTTCCPNIVYQPNWVDTDTFFPLPLANKKKDILFVGRLESQKRPLLFLDAYKKIGKGVSGTLVGTGSLASTVSDIVADNDLSLHFLHNRLPNNDLIPIYQSHKVYVLTSSYEGGSAKTVLEAMACGVPVVVTNGFGLAATVTDGYDGFVCPPDPDILAKKIDLLLTNESVYTRMSEHARSTSIQKFSMQAVLKNELAWLHNY